MTRRGARIGLGIALLGFAALRVGAAFQTAFNWDEFALLDSVARSAREGRLESGGHAGLPQVALLRLVEACRDEISVARSARLAWLALTWAYLAGVFVWLRELLPADRHRQHDAALGTALLGLAPVFLEWSLQVRSDQVALAGGAWGGALLLASRRHAGWALAAGLAFGLGWLGSQKLAYVATLAALLALGQHWVDGAWRPRRELLRAAALGLGAGVVLLAWRGFVSTHFEVPETHSALRGAAPEVVRNYLDIFDFYRATIGYSQLVAALPGLALQLALGVAVLLTSVASRRARSRRLALAWAVLALGAAVAAFHKAAFAYFLMTLLLFVALGLGLALPALRAALTPRWPEVLRLATPVVWAALILGAGLHSAAALRDTQSVQRESLRFVHRNFAPDRAGFHPETALFCGARQPLGLWFSQRIWRAFEGPRADREVENLLARFRAEPVHYLVQSFRLNQFPTPVRRFWAEHYQPYRDAVFVAGHRLRGAAGESRDFELLVAGPYRWLPLGGDHGIRLDGQRVAAGEVVELAASRHRVEFEGAEGAGLLVLALPEPPGPAPLPFYKAY